MIKGFYIIVFLFLFSVLLDGCLTDPFEIAKTDLAVNKFLEDNPNAEVLVIHLSTEQATNMIDDIKAVCGEQTQAKEYYKVSITDKTSDLKLVSYIDVKNKQVECVHKFSGEEALTETAKDKDIIVKKRLSEKENLIQECTLACACTEAFRPALIDSCSFACSQIHYGGGDKALVKKIEEMWGRCKLLPEEVEKLYQESKQTNESLIEECILACACERADRPAMLDECKYWCYQHRDYAGENSLRERTEERWKECTLSPEEVEKLAYG